MISKFLGLQRKSAEIYSWDVFSETRASLSKYRSKVRDHCILNLRIITTLERSADQPQYAGVNRRECHMLRESLPALDAFLTSKCKGFFRLPMPTLVHCHYDGRGSHDVFVLENLLAEDYYNFTNEKCLNVEHMEAVLDSLAYLHGTGLAYKLSDRLLPIAPS